jgi:hypothetical protein
MRHNERVIGPQVVLVGAAVGAFFLGCTRNEQLAYEIGKQLDPVGKALDRYGTVSISSPLLLEPGDYFEFKLDRAAGKYFDEARSDLQGGKISLQQTASETSAGAEFRANLESVLVNVLMTLGYTKDAATFEANRRLAEAEQAGATSRPAVPEFRGNVPAAQPGVLPDPDLAKRVFLAQQFKEMFGLLGNLSLVSTNNSAITLAAGNKTTEAIFRVLGKPELEKDFEDKRVLCGVAMVSVDPGEETRQGYVADVSVAVSYAYQPARASLIRKFLKDPNATDARALINAFGPEYNKPPTRNGTRTTDDANGPQSKDGSMPVDAHTPALDTVARQVEPAPGAERFVRGQILRTSGVPLVCAISPMTEVQSLQLASALREQRAVALRIALALSGMGAEPQAAVLKQYAERLESEVVTRTGLNTVGAYSHSGNSFGYQIGPSLMAETGGLWGGVRGLMVGRPRPGPGMLLQRQAFPVLVIVGMDDEDLTLRAQLYDGRLQLMEPSLLFTQTIRWVPMASVMEGSSLRPLTGGLARSPVGGVLGAIGSGALDVLWGQKGIPESERLQWAMRLQKASAYAQGTSVEALVHAKRVLDELSNPENPDWLTARDPQQQRHKIDAAIARQTLWELANDPSLPTSARILPLLRPKSARWWTPRRQMIEHVREFDRSVRHKIYPEAEPKEPNEPKWAQLRALINWKLKPDLERSQDQELLSFARERIELLKSQLLHSSSLQRIPIRLFVESSPPAPSTVTALTPARILAPGDPNEPNKIVSREVIVRGTNLDKVDSVESVDMSVLSAELLTEKCTQNGERLKDCIVVKVTPNSALTATVQAVLKLCGTFQGKEYDLFSPPLEVTVFDPRVRITATSGPAPGSIEYRYPKDAEGTVIGLFGKQNAPANQPAPPPPK